MSLGIKGAATAPITTSATMVGRLRRHNCRAMQNRIVPTASNITARVLLRKMLATAIGRPASHHIFHHHERDLRKAQNKNGTVMVILSPKRVGWPVVPNKRRTPPASERASAQSITPGALRV